LGQSAKDENWASHPKRFPIGNRIGPATQIKIWLALKAKLGCARKKGQQEQASIILINYLIENINN
jgi:hypothetical protein